MAFCVKEEQLTALLDNVDVIGDYELEQFRDPRGFKVQHFAAELGHIEALNELITRGFEFEVEIDGKTPAALAFDNKHYNIVLNLLKANFKFPRNYDNKIASDDLKEFVRLSSELHESIKSEEIVKIEEILKRNSHLKYFYNAENKSAVRVALENKKFKAYEVLLTNQVYISPFEELRDIFKQLSHEERLELRDLNVKLSLNVQSEPITTFMQNSHFGPDCPDHNNYRILIFKAYLYLLQIPRIAILFNVVAASKFFKIVFDFKREFVDYLDPTTEPYTNGLFYMSGRIFIGAKGMLDPSRFNEVVSVIAHELCHYAMFLVYGNFAKPYKIKNKKKEEEFNKVQMDCSVHKDLDEIIEVVFDDYPRSMQHAELIVRPPQMMAQYHENREILEERIEKFPSLFNYFDDCLPEMENAIPAIRNRFKTEAEKKFEKQRKMIFWISVLSIFLVTSLGFLAYWLNSQNYSWETLSTEQKLKVNDAIVNYFDVEVKFGDLFANNSEVYDSLTPKEISGALKDDPVELSKSVNSVYNSLIHLSWLTLPGSLKDKLMNSNVTFQGESLKINEFLKIDSTALNYLESYEIKGILAGSQIQISSKVHTKSNFYVERLFVSEKGQPEHSLNEIITTMPDMKVFLLSSPAGEGKSTTFKNFSSKLKKKFPWKWVEFVDLKKHLEAFEVGNELNFSVPVKLVEYLSKNLIISKFEREIFTELFQKGDVVFLWDGVDEIAPLYKDFMLNLASNISKTTENWQFISTRPQHFEDFSLKLNVKAHKLLPLDEAKRLEFLVKFVVSRNLQVNANDFYEKIEPSLNSTTGEISINLKNLNIPLNEPQFIKILKTIKQGKRILTSIDNSNNGPVSNPLLIQMTAEISSDNNFKITEKFNIYAFYDAFVDKKGRIALEKGGFVAKDVTKISNSRLTNYKASHEPFALKLIFNGFIDGKIKVDFNFNLSFLNSKIEKISKESLLMISRYGILTVNSETDFSFNHRTFAEFFVAQYFINEAQDFSGLSQLEIKTKIYLLNAVLYSDGFETVRRFVLDYMDSKIEETVFIKHLKESKTTTEKLWNLTKNEQILSFFNFVEVMNFFTKTVSLDQIFYEWNWFKPKHWNFQDIFANWKELKEILGDEKLKIALKVRDEFGRNFLFLCVGYTETYDNLLIEFLSIYEEYFDPKDFYNDYKGDNAFMVASVHQNEKVLKEFWNFTKNKFKKSEIDKILSTKKETRTCLNLALFNPDRSCFLLMMKIYRNNFDDEKLQKIILEFNEKTFPFIFHIFNGKNLKFAQITSDFFLDVFKGNKFALRNLLNRRNEENQTMFEYFKESSNFLTEMQEIFENLLRKTYESEEFMLDWRKNSIFEAYFDGNYQDYEILFDQTWQARDFEYFLANWESFGERLGSEDFHALLTYQTYFGTSLLTFLFSEDISEKIVEDFLMKLNSTLSHQELIEILKVHYKFSHPMTHAVSKSGLNEVKFFWNFIKSVLEVDEKAKIFKSDEILTKSLLNKNPEVFKFVTEIYEIFFTKTEIQSFMLREESANKRPSIIDIILREGSSLKIVEDFVKYLEKLFYGDEEGLKELFELKNFKEQKIVLDIDFKSEFIKEKKKTLKDFYEKMTN